MQSGHRQRAEVIRQLSLLALGSLRQQSAGMAKAAKAASAGGSSNSGGNAKIQLLLNALKPEPPKKVSLSPEELEDATRRAKEYSRLKMREHRLWQADLTTKLKLKRAAVDALPLPLKAAALEPDTEPFPTNRLVWTTTPPKEDVSEDRQKDEGGAKKGKPRKVIGTKKR
jgi:hypothetical protein